MSFAENYRRQVHETIDKIDLAKVQLAIDWLRQARDAGRNIYTCGNGCSASTASHLACELLKTASYGRAKRFRAIALAEAIGTVTALGNDVGYDSIFVEQLKNFAQAGDVLVAFSGSGNSPNVVEAARYASSVGCRTIGLTGRDGGKLAAVADLNVLVPVQHMGLIEDAHVVICHMIGYHFMECPEG